MNLLLVSPSPVIDRSQGIILSSQYQSVIYRLVPEMLYNSPTTFTSGADSIEAESRHYHLPVSQGHRQLHGDSNTLIWKRQPFLPSNIIYFIISLRGNSTYKMKVHYMFYIEVCVWLHVSPTSLIVPSSIGAGDLHPISQAAWKNPYMVHPPQGSVGPLLIRGRYPP